MTATKVDLPELTARLRVLLPESYQVFDTAIQPRSMGSAGLKFGPDGKVLWGEMWASFCHLAMAGGPPHRGTLLQPSHMAAQEIGSPEYQAVVTEIGRGISLVTGLCAEQSPFPGWLRMYGTSAAMCGWLARAIVMENVCAHASGLSLYLPAGPAFRVEKEIKNVITSVAKTCHYWQDHMGDAQHDEIAALLADMDRATPLVPIAMQAQNKAAEELLHADPVPADRSLAERALAAQLAAAIAAATDLAPSFQAAFGWLGIDCGSVAASIAMMRALCVCNLLARREQTVVLVPVNPEADPHGERTLQGFLEAYRLATALHAFD